MDRKVKLKITTTRERTIKVQAALLRARCPVCEREVAMVTSEEAAGILKVDDQALNRMMDEGLVHSIQTVSGSLWVCKDSLFVERENDR